MPELNFKVVEKKENVTWYEIISVFEDGTTEFICKCKELEKATLLSKLLANTL